MTQKQLNRIQPSFIYLFNLIINYAVPVTCQRTGDLGYCGSAVLCAPNLPAIITPYIQKYVSLCHVYIRTYIIDETSAAEELPKMTFMGVQL